AGRLPLLPRPRRRRRQSQQTASRAAERKYGNWNQRTDERSIKDYIMVHGSGGGPSS
ncbi:unnamed protein product, partial [Musa acuminata subsp. burmannicoides]